jgi:hypothetical protein
MTTKNNSPYIPSFIKTSLSDARPQQLTFADLANTNIQSTSSFKYDPIDSPLKNTQQLNLDWSKFENHTFFNSAEVKTNVAFDQIINGYPFDGTRIEVEHFFERMGGFEKWLYDKFPVFGGELHFSGTAINEDPQNGYAEKLGTWIEVKDVMGALYPDLSKNKSGESVLNPPSKKSFTIEAHVFLPNEPNNKQIILQKLSSDLLQGFTLHLDSSIGETVTGIFDIISGSSQNTVKATLNKGKFNHICASLNRENKNNLLQFYVDEKLAGESKKIINIGEFNDVSSLFIGSGSCFYSDGAIVNPLQTFSGTLDEFRIFHSYRNVQQQQLLASKGLYASPDTLKLYYRFNEPSTLLAANINDPVNSIVLDSSGNSLHSLISNFDVSLRRSATNDQLSPMVNEKAEFKKILFPYNPEVAALNSEILASASYYDEQNPNTITKLIPRHYLREGALSEGYANTSVEGSIGDVYGGEGIPGQGSLGSTQIMLTFLYIWAKFFDEIKIFIDAMKTLKTVSYASYENVPDNFLNNFIRSYGMYLPPLFNSSNIQQYVDGEDINEIGISDFSLKSVQTQLLRRVLINMPDVLKSKGTQHSIRSFLRSVGIDPENSLRIREFGGPSLRQLGTTRETRSEPMAVVDFYPESIVTSPFLYSSRIEPGYPPAVGPFSNGISTYESDGLLTSGSWTYEGFYKYNNHNIKRLSSNNQSLMRLQTTGSLSYTQPGVVLNVVASLKEKTISAYIRPGMGINSPLLQLSLKDVDIFDGEKWNISVGCLRNDAILSEISSSYFLRAASQSSGEITKSYLTSSFFKEEFSSEGNVFRLIDATANASGSRLVIGNDPQVPVGGFYFLNSSFMAPELARTVNFEGQLSNVRFWSKGLTEEEWIEHVRNYRSFGIEDPLTNYNYVTNKDGSFERLRLRSFEKQEDRMSDDGGGVKFLDFSENNFYMTGSGFPSAQKVMIGDVTSYSYISPYFDEYSSSEKIRIRSFQDENYLKNSPWATMAPLYEIPPNEVPLDDPRFSIEFSLIDSLNKDIVTMFSNLDFMANAIGSPELLYSSDYPELEKLSNVYFNRIKNKLNFRNFFEFYRWFDASISTFIQQLVPRKTKFKGTNFVIESHLLERHKLEYQSSEIYLGDSQRSRIRDVLLSQQIAGNISKY